MKKAEFHHTVTQTDKDCCISEIGKIISLCFLIVNHPRTNVFTKSKEENIN